MYGFLSLVGKDPWDSCWELKTEINPSLVKGLLNDAGL
jgi:hypothetical protein